MGKSTVVVIWLALAALALRPIEGVDRAARLVFEPARVLARVAAPFTWGSSAQASSDGEARARVRELLLAEQEDARPAERSLSFSAHLPESVAFKKLLVNLRDMMEYDEARVRFYPNGTCDALAATLLSEQNEERTITLEITTGRDHLEIVR